MSDYHDIDDGEVQDLEEMVKDGEVWACCPHCRLFMSSIHETVCSICKGEIELDEVIIEFIDWSQPN